MPAPAAARQSAHPGGWFATPLARRLVREEQHEAIPLLTGCFGRNGLYLRGEAGAPEELSGNMLQQVVRLHRAPDALRGDVICHEDELPLQRESIDLVYLLHALETCPDARGLLREVERVLAPDGTVLIVALNPYSPWRLRWAGGGVRPWSFGACRTLLRDSGLDVVRHCGLGPLRPWLREGAGFAVTGGTARDPWAVWRAGYLVQARKHRPTLTPVRPLPAGVAFQTGMRAG
jgi:SAM-dependent methyltransferase